MIETKTIFPVFLDFRVRKDERGTLIAIESNQHVPFEIKMVYYIFDVKNDVRRGSHAHKTLQQVMICLRGSCKILLDDGENRVEDIVLDSPEKGLLIDKMIWREIYDFSDDCILLVLANNFHCEDDYIRDYNEFLKFRKLNYDNK